jgi:hypothetical protein
MRFLRDSATCYIFHFLLFLLFIPMVHPNAADAIFHRDSATCIASFVSFHIFFRNFYEISSALTSVQWRRRGPLFFIGTALRVPLFIFSLVSTIAFSRRYFFCSGLPVNPLFFIGPVPTRSLRDSAKCCIFNHFLVDDSFRGRRREFLHRDSATCTASLLTAHTC